ncbi:hypothetical protein C0J52_28094 [Blattella germanica]|nr:hypothetical protein C0J52_28094 [Blattella germanica]
MFSLPSAQCAGLAHFLFVMIELHKPRFALPQQELYEVLHDKKNYNEALDEYVLKKYEFQNFFSDPATALRSHSEKVNVDQQRKVEEEEEGEEEKEDSN